MSLKVRYGCPVRHAGITVPQILRLKEKLLDINIPKQQFEKQTQINNIDV